MSKKISRGRLNVHQKWIHNTEDMISASPLLVDRNPVNTVVVTHKGNVIALGTQGELLWRFNASEKLSVTESFFVDDQKINSIVDTPLLADIDDDGQEELVFSTMGGSIYCITLEGNLKWQFQTEGICYASPLMTTEGNKPVLIFGGHDKHLYKLSGTGKLLLKEEVGMQIENKITRVNELLIFGSHEGYIAAFSLGFQKKWTVKTEARITAEIISGVLTEDKQEILIVGSQDGILYALNLYGETIWRFKTKGAIISAVIIDDVFDDDSKDILVGSCDNNIYCVDAFGELNWSYETDFWIVSSPVSTSLLNGNKQIIVGSYDQKVYILEGQGTYALSYIPGIASIVNQTGQHTITAAKEAGESKGKKVLDWDCIGQVVGYVQQENNLIITTKEGNVVCYQLR